ncbi:MAG: sulfite exporter TauE/SafE family protein [Myxococcales bacterium]|nr:sulfite exporter TauE/SafE family protein [Myxococcales bacterium]MDH5565139.1 sulfite exporter TauE/SafE family protein [Myxococcales bacterium]
MLAPERSLGWSRRRRRAAREAPLQDPHSIVALLPFVALLLGAGLVAGFVAGLIGVGGGIVLVPVLYHVFEHFGVDPNVRMHLAVGTSLSTIVFTAWRSMRAHRARGAVDEALLRSWIAPVLFGVLVGVALASVLGGRVLALIFGGVALGVALHMALGNAEWRVAELPQAGLLRSALGAAIGCCSVLLGLGGGTLAVPTLTLLGVPIRRAVGTAAGLGLLISLPGTLGFVLAGVGVPERPPLSLGYVNLLGLALIAPVTMLAAPWGAGLAHAVPRVGLRRAFALFLAVTSVRMLLADG